MKFDKVFIVSILLLAILAIGAVSASEDISDDVAAVEPSDDVISDQIDDSLEETVPPVENLEADDSQDEILEDETEVLSFTDLKTTVESGQTEINLTHDYKYNESSDKKRTEIWPNNAFVLDGKGHTLDGAGAELRFSIWHPNVTIKNLIFKNFKQADGTNYYYIYWANNATGGRIENCTFENMTYHSGLTYPGGLMWLHGGDFTIKDCTFNGADMDDYIDIQDDDIALSGVQIDNCTFSNINVSKYYFISAGGNGANNIHINNCSFDGINASWGFIHLYGNSSQITNSTFKNNIGFNYLTEQQGNDCIMHNCTFEKNFAYFDEASTDRLPITKFGHSSISYDNISVTNVTFNDNRGIPILWYGNSGNVTGCVFENNNGTIVNRGDGNVYRDNGKYDYEVIVYNDTIAGYPSDYYYGPENKLADVMYYGNVQRSGSIVILLNGTECYKKELESESASIKLDELSQVPMVGDVPIVVKFTYGENDWVLYNGTAYIDYSIQMACMSYQLFPHGTLDYAIILPNDAKGTLIFYDGIKNSTVEYADGKAIYTLYGTDYKEPKVHYVAVSLIGDPKYPNKTVRSQFFWTYKVKMSNYVSEGEINYMTLDFPDNFEGNVIVYNATKQYYEYGYEYIKDQLVLNESFKGLSQFPLPALVEGTYYFIIEVPGINSTIPVYCIKNQEGINSSINSGLIGPGNDVILTVNCQLSNCTLYLLVDETEINYGNHEMIELNDTALNHNISNLTLGVHKIKLFIYQNDTEMVYSATHLVAVKADPVLNIADVDDFVEGNPVTINITANQTFSGTVTISVNDVELGEASLTNGVGSFKIAADKLKVGLNNVIVSIENNDYFMDDSVEISFKVIPKDGGNSTPAKKVPAKIVAKNYSAYYNKGTYKVTVYGTDGKVAKGVKVVFRINGKKVKTVTTNKKGIATFKIPKKYVPKTYKIKITALGKTVTKKLVIKQVLKLKKVKIKKSAKRLVIKATLKEGKKALKGKKIIFKFKGKKYTKKTNKKGIAKLVIKKKVLKKLKKGKKVTYKATYLKDTVKRTVKVKK